MQTKLDFDSVVDSAEDSPLDSGTPLNWIIRTYQSRMEWQAKARMVFISVNGDSDVARNRVAAQVREFFKDTDLAPEDVERWKKGTNEKETIRVNPPKKSEASSGYVDWLHIADFLLMAGCSSTEEIDEEQQIRETEFQEAHRSYRMRLVVEEARKELRNDPSLSDDEIIQRLKDRCTAMFKDKKGPPLTAVDEARKLEKSGTRTPVPKAPLKPNPLPRYTTLYGND